MLNRRRFVQSMLAAPVAFYAFDAPLVGQNGGKPKGPVPSYLKNHADLYERDPHAAALAWFQNAKWGLFMHYGLYSQLGRGEWVMQREKIPVGEYEKLSGTF